MAIIEGIGDEVLAALIGTILSITLYIGLSGINIFRDFGSLFHSLSPSNDNDGGADGEARPSTESINTDPPSPESPRAEQTEDTNSQPPSESESSAANDPPEPTTLNQPSSPEFIRSQRNNFYQGTSPPPPPSPPSPPQEASNLISIRLKYLNDTEKTANCDPRKTVLEFKRTTFVTELEANKRVKLIYNGRLLHDTDPMSTYRVYEHCVIHVQICQNQPPPSAATFTEQDFELDLSGYLWPMLALGLGIMWFLRFKFKEHFDGITTAILVSLSFFFLTIILGSRYFRNIPT